MNYRKMDRKEEDNNMIIGIDLGTTNSLIACFTEDGPKIIPNRLGKHLTPSVVSMDEAGGNLSCCTRNLLPKNYHPLSSEP